MTAMKTYDERAKQLVRDIILKCFVKDDEVDTRVAIYSAFRQKEKTKDANEKKLIKEVEKEFNSASFEELEAIYNEFSHSSFISSFDNSKEESSPKNNKKGALFDYVFKKKTKECPLYFEGREEVLFIKLKTFSFEGKYYALLKSKDDNTTLYFYYTYFIESDDNFKERLVPLTDAVLINIFEQLDL